MPGRGVDRRAMRTGAGNVPDLGERVEVIDGNVSGGAGAGDIKIAAVGVGGHVIESAIAPDHLNLEDLVGAAVLGVDRSAAMGTRTASIATNSGLADIGFHLQEQGYAWNLANQ